MKGKIKIRTMKDDLASSDNESGKLLKEEQGQKKPDIATAEISGSVVAPDTTSGKLKDEEIDELKNLIERISKNDDEKESVKKDTEEETAIVDTASEEKATEQEEKQVDLKSDDKKELEDLIDKISETIDKKENQEVQTEKTDDELEEKRAAEIEKTEEDKQSFWNNISKKLKDDKPTEPRKITKRVEDIKNIEKENKEKEYKNSGVLTKEKSLKTEKEPEKKKEAIKSFYNDDGYQSPENRLIFGKQKKYSSVSKRIKLKEKKDEIEDMKSTAEMKEKQKIISEKEKYKKLKSRVIKKYNIKLFSLPWKKIIPIALLLIILSGAIYYVLVRKLTPTPFEPPVVIIGTEIKEFAQIKSSIEFTKDDIVKMGFKESAINEKFGRDDDIKELRIVIKDDNNIVSLKEALEDIRIETKNFPDSFWETTTESYNIFAIKTGTNAFRFAIAIESNDLVSLLKTMGDWEQESVAKKKMFKVFEPLFTDSKIEERFDQRFEFTNYGYTYIRYINLPTKDISFDYFAKNNILVIATSKENTIRIIDILNYDYNYDYDYYDYYDYEDYDIYEN
ncbi:MAG: hypothetical protein KAQ87_01925 [Candidatus Pacebacteria bacterium]|nr:hypothetical protein [Candidatus Paceibacterota bacterium]